MASSPASCSCTTSVRGGSERLEEEHIFPRFERSNRLVDLVAILRRQHRRGRDLTDRIRALAAGNEVRVAGRREELRGALRGFVDMYRPHAAREDTVLFPALHDVIPARDYRDLGERFEEEEHRRFGDDGFTGIVASVAELERRVDIHALEQAAPATTRGTE
jgi:hemerythrin-like domain-containing protein